ncbi:MAG: HYR domain-containing protein [Phycisphaerae bacterium]|nr:HYR domain-containing protein [Phycisphaerae bacterium]
MRDVQAPGSTGFQAFVEYDNALLTYRDDLSSYTGAPFSLHILNFGAAPPFNIEWAPGSLRLDGSAAPFQAPSTGDAKLATLIFDVLDECATTSLEFGGYPAFPVFFSELSLYGVPIATVTTNTDPLDLDDTPPVITCPADITTAAQIFETDVCSTSNCCTSHGGAGCTDAGCQATVCGVDPFCCNFVWDSICAGEAVVLCPPTTDPCSGAVVTYSVGASDNCGTPLVVCTPPSGSVFPVGTTTVNCTAIDDCGNQSSCSFDITVTPTNYVEVDVALLVGSFTAPAANRCIHFSTDSCGATTDETLAFSDDGLGFQTTGSVFIEVPCGDWSSLCVKDEQHSKWTTVGLVSVGTHYVATSTAVLLPGDTDNDGDVDINDVTWLIFTYGAPAALDPCPYTFPGPGPRDADFSLNGVVSGEDYSLLSDQFLTFSSCICTLPAEGPAEPSRDERRSIPTHELDARMRERVDLNNDGVFDADDILIFEGARGLPQALSTRMRDAIPRDRSHRPQTR